MIVLSWMFDEHNDKLNTENEMELSVLWFHLCCNRFLQVKMCIAFMHLHMRTHL